MTLAEHAKLFVDMEPHVETLVRYAKDAKVIIEFGVRTGVSTWAFLDGMSDDGRLYGVDFDDRILSEGWLPARVKDDPRLTYIFGDDRSPDVLGRLPSSPDILMIDTSHTYQHTLDELGIALGLKAKVIILHDWELPEVSDAVKTFLDMDPGYVIDYIEDSQWGLVVLRLAGVV